MTEKEIMNFKENFQIRYSGSLAINLGESILPRIVNDPYDRNIIKMIDPSTCEILFDSQITRDISSKKGDEIWRSFKKRYSYI